MLKALTVYGERWVHKQIILKYCAKCFIRDKMQVLCEPKRRSNPTRGVWKNGLCCCCLSWGLLLLYLPLLQLYHGFWDLFLKAAEAQSSRQSSSGTSYIFQTHDSSLSSTYKWVPSPKDSTTEFFLHSIPSFPHPLPLLETRVLAITSLYYLYGNKKLYWSKVLCNFKINLLLIKTKFLGQPLRK